MKTMRQIAMIAEKVEEYIECLDHVIHRRSEPFFAQIPMNLANCDRPLNIEISDDGEWVMLALDLGVNCLPGCEQRLLTYCMWLCMNASQYVQGTFQLHSDNELYFCVSIPSDQIMTDAAYFLDKAIDQSADMLERFYPIIQKLCTGKILEYADFYVITSDAEDSSETMPSEKYNESELQKALENFMQETAEAYMENEICESRDCFYLCGELIYKCRQKNLILGVSLKDHFRVCIDLELPLQKMPDTEPILRNYFQKIYTSPNWHQGTFCIDECGKVLLRMGLDGQTVLRCPEMLKTFTADGIQLIYFCFAALNNAAQGKLLQDELGEIYFYEPESIFDENKNAVEWEENVQQMDGGNNSYDCVWDDLEEVREDDQDDTFDDAAQGDFVWRKLMKPDDPQEPENFEQGEQEWEEFCKEFEQG